MSFTLLQFSDCHLLADPDDTLLGLHTEQTLKAVLACALERYPVIDFMVFSGDVSNCTDVAVYERLQSYLPQGIPCLWLPGNHDENRLMEQVFQKGWLPCYPLGNWCLTLLDSSMEGKVEGYVTDQELTRFKTAIEAHPDKHHAIFMHHHLKPVGSEWIDRLGITNGAEVLDQLTEYKALKFIANGHVHQAKEDSHRGVDLLSAPSTCFQFLPGSEKFALDCSQMPGFRAFTLEEDGSFQHQVHRIPEQSFTLDKAAGGY